MLVLHYQETEARYHTITEVQEVSSFVVRVQYDWLQNRVREPQLQFLTLMFVTEKSRKSTRVSLTQTYRNT